MKKRFLFLILGVLVIVVFWLLISKGFLLAGDMFTPSKVISVKLPSTNKLAINAKGDIKSDVENIWGKEITKNGKSKIETCFTGDVNSKVKNGYKILLQEKYNDVTNVVLISPLDIELTTPEIIGGRILLREVFSYFKKNNVVYPCENLIINTHFDAALGTAGFLYIGGFGGFNQISLLYHELLHGFFNGYSVDSLWLKEKAASVWPLIIIDNVKKNIPWNLENFPFIPNLKTSFVQGKYEEFTEEGFIYYDEGLVYSDKNVCDLSDPESVQNPDEVYEENNIWGNVFLLDLTVNFGEKSMVDTLKALYEKYSYNVDEKIKDWDFYSAFLYYIKKNNPSKYSEVKVLMDKKLCIE